MGDTGQQPVTYIGIHERTPELPILYISSSVRQALLFEPHEVIGHSVKEYIANSEDAEAIVKEHGSYSEANVIKTSVVGRRKDGAHVFFRSIAFACGNATFHMATVYPSAHISEQNERVSIQKFRCDLNEKHTRGGEHVLFSEHSSGNTSESSEVAERDVCRNMAPQTKRTYQACIVLEDLRANNTDGNIGARIVFVTDSINKVLNTEACDLRGVPFLSLIALEDITKAAMFLDKSLHGSVLSLERLRLLANPLKDSQLGYPQCVYVEFMAMGSDDGAIMLCQLEQSMGDGSSRNSGYMSFEKLMSADPGTSGIL